MIYKMCISIYYFSIIFPWKSPKNYTFFSQNFNSFLLVDFTFNVVTSPALTLTVLWQCGSHFATLFRCYSRLFSLSLLTNSIRINCHMAQRIRSRFTYFFVFDIAFLFEVTKCCWRRKKIKSIFKCVWFNFALNLFKHLFFLLFFTQNVKKKNELKNEFQSKLICALSESISFIICKTIWIEQKNVWSDVYAQFMNFNLNILKLSKLKQKKFNRLTFALSNSKRTV